MNYQELEKVLQGPLTYTNTSDKKLIEHFQEKFKMVPYNNDFLFIFHHEREFENKIILFLYINEIVDEYQCIFFIISLLPMFTQGQ